MNKASHVLAIIGAVLPFSFSIAHSEPNKEAYELQDRCGRRAAEVFAKNYENFELGGRRHMYNYRNHYSARLNKCFFLVLHNDYSEKPTQDLTRTLELLDVNENNRYGLFIGVANSKSPPAECEVRGQRCTSEAEWVDLTNPYMED